MTRVFSIGKTKQCFCKEKPHGPWRAISPNGPSAATFEAWLHHRLTSTKSGGAHFILPPTQDRNSRRVKHCCWCWECPLMSGG